MEIVKAKMSSDKYENNLSWFLQNGSGKQDSSEGSEILQKKKKLNNKVDICNTNVLLFFIFIWFSIHSVSAN